MLEERVYEQILENRDEIERMVRGLESREREHKLSGQMEFPFYDSIENIRKDWDILNNVPFYTCLKYDIKNIYQKPFDENNIVELVMNPVMFAVGFGCGAIDNLLMDKADLDFPIMSIYMNLMNYGLGRLPRINYYNTCQATSKLMQVSVIAGTIAGLASKYFS